MKTLEIIGLMQALKAHVTSISYLLSTLPQLYCVQ